MAKAYSFKELFDQFEDEAEQLEDAIIDKMAELTKPMEDFRKGLQGKGDPNLANMESKVDAAAKAQAANYQSQLASNRKSGEEEERLKQEEADRLRRSTPLDKLGGILAQGLGPNGVGQTSQTTAAAKQFGDTMDREAEERRKKREEYNQLNPPGTPLSRAMSGAAQSLMGFGGPQLGMLGGAKAAGGKLSHALTNSSGAGTISDTMGAAGNVLGSMGPYGKAAEGLLKVGAAAFSAVDKVKEWTNAVHNSNMQFAKYSGAMAGVQARADVREIQHEQRMGDALAEDAEKTAQQKARTQKAWEETDTFVAKAQNRIVRNFSDLSEGFGNLLAGRAAHPEGSKDDYIFKADAWMDEAADKWFEEWNKPKRFR